RPADRWHRRGHAGAPRWYEGERRPKGEAGLDEGHGPREGRRIHAALARRDGALIRERTSAGARLRRPEDGDRGRGIPPGADPRGRWEGVRERRPPVRRDDRAPPRPRPDSHGPCAVQPPERLPDLPRGGMPELHDHLLREQARPRRRDLGGPGANRRREVATERLEDPDRQAWGRPGDVDLCDRGLGLGEGTREVAVDARRGIPVLPDPE